jgi:GNAT superfamily N-acetyltransferase
MVSRAGGFASARSQANVARMIRDLRAGDLDALLALYRQLHPADEALSPARAAETWARISSDPSQIYLGAFVDERLAAACNAVVVPNLTRGARPYALIENVVTHESFRRRGIGSQLMRALVQRCWERGCYKIMLMSAAARDEAHRFYTALGFDGGSKQAFVLKR